jgi:hypothetical protein
MWTLAFGQHEDRWLTHGYEATREAAVDAGDGAPRPGPSHTWHAPRGSKRDRR